MTDLAGRTILITGVGGAGQVGEAVARAFAEQRARVALVARAEQEARERAEALRAAGGDAHAFACDLTDAAATDAVAKAAQERVGDLDALVCVAGGFTMTGPIAESDLAGWHQQIAINLTTAYVATRAFLPAVRRRQGAVIYFASAAALPGASVGGMAAYAAAKSGVVALMRAVAHDERGAGVRANAVAPTSIRTATNEASMGANAKYVEREAVAEVVTWLCSPAAAAITGQVIRIG